MSGFTEAIEKVGTSKDYLSFITAVNFTKRELQELNGMTFLVDPNWQVGFGDSATLPFALFHVKNQHESMDTDTSQKQVLLYDSGKQATADATTGGVTAVIADNIVIKPKTYKLEVIVPYSPLGLSMGSGMLNQYQVNGVNSFMARTSSDDVSRSGANDVSAYVQQFMRGFNLIKELILDFVNPGSKSYVIDVLTNFSSANDYNKDSLEAMWHNRSVLKMKTWDDWRFKYVIIKNMDLAKEGAIGNNYEGTITLQEVPILTIRSSLSKAKAKAGWGIPKLVNSIRGVK